MMENNLCESPEVKWSFAHLSSAILDEKNIFSKYERESQDCMSL